MSEATDLDLDSGLEDESIGGIVAPLDALGPGTLAEPDEPIRAIDTLRRGMAATPVLRRGIRWALALAVFSAAGRLVVPVLVQQILDDGFDETTGVVGFDMEFVVSASLVAGAVVLLVSAAAYLADVRMATAAETALRDLRMLAFRKVHALSLNEHADERKGVLVSRVTSDVEAIARFADWGALSWFVQSMLLLFATGLMLFYSWQLTLISYAVMLGMIVPLRWIQRRQVTAYDLLRTRVGETLSETSETIGGAETIRAYGYRPAARRRLTSAIDNEYRAAVTTARYFSVLFTIADVFGTLAIMAITVVASVWGPGFGLSLGDVVAFFLLLQRVQGPIAELTEVLDQTQTAIAGWNKVLTLLDREEELTDPDPGARLPGGPLRVEADGVTFAYGETAPVLHGIDVVVPAGSRVAIVGETGSGKTTFAKLLCRLADPDEGVIRLGGVDLATASGDSRRASVRMVPQDGYLFPTTIRENIRFGRDGASDSDIELVVSELRLDWWIDRLPAGLETDVGHRGDNLSVGERQLVALLRAQLASPGLLVLDEATSSVDPETEQALADALDRVAAGRTMVSIAHRLSTAERSDLVLVFDDGFLIEQGSHEELVAFGGVYATLHESWQRTVQ